jgi:hypothetical protein
LRIMMTSRWHEHPKFQHSLSNLLSGNVSRSNVERLAGIIFYLDAICRDII